MLLAVAASIVVGKSFKSKLEITPPFRFFTIDKICFVLLILSFIVSLAYMIHEIQSLPRLVIRTHLEMALFILLHLAAVAWVLFTITVAKHQVVLSRNTISSKS